MRLAKHNLNIDMTEHTTPVQTTQSKSSHALPSVVANSLPCSLTTQDLITTHGLKQKHNVPPLIQALQAIMK